MTPPEGAAPAALTVPAGRVSRFLEADRVLGTRRSALVVALTVFVMTTIQVFANPVAALIQGVTEWPLPTSIPVTFAILVAGCAVQAASFLLSDRWPQATVLITTAVYLGLGLGVQVPTWVAGMYLVIALALFLLATRSPLFVSAVWVAAIVTVVLAALFWWLLSIGREMTFAIGYVAASTPALIAPAIGAIALGTWWGTQTRRVSLARAQAEAAEREHDQRVEQAEQRERTRIAQELHDVAGQHLAGLITLADAALTIAPARPDDALHLVEEVRNEGRFAAASLAGALTDLSAVGATPRETTRDMRQADELLEYWQKRGMSIRMSTSGAIDELPAVVSATAYRCAQEAITNAAKHAPGADVDVEVAAQPHRLEVVVANGTSPTGTPPIPGLGLGWGLRGIRERIDLLRGTLVFGSTPEDGWMVRFVIPVAPAD